MASSFAKTTPNAKHAPISGPHVCAHVGRSTLTLARKVLLDACERSANGTLSAQEITATLDLMASLPQMFALYGNAFNSCANLHKNRGFAKIDPEAFAYFIFRAYCQDTARAMFQQQIAQGGDKWLGLFIQGLVKYVQKCDADFNDRLFACYRKLALSHGKDLTLAAFYGDDALVRLAAEAARHLDVGQAHASALTDVVNAHLAQALKLTGPSPAKICDSEVHDFLLALKTDSQGNMMRRKVNEAINAC